MSFVLDCSMTMAWVFPDEANQATDDLRERLLKDNAIVPVLWSIEVGKRAAGCDTLRKDHRG